MPGKLTAEQRKSRHFPRKRLGQHFLVSPGVARRVVALAGVESCDAVLEIGPGKGALSDFLAQAAGRLYLVEVDNLLADRLRVKFAGQDHVTVITADILALDLQAALAEEAVKVVANLPYNIATEVIFRLLAQRRKFPDLTLMLQQEVAARIRARPGCSQYGVPSLLVQLYADILGGFRVAPGSFRPRPQVMSEVVRLKINEKPRFPLLLPEGEEIFTALVRAAFGQRRKMLRGALRGVRSRYLPEGAQPCELFSQAGVLASLRGEQLGPEKFVALANLLVRWRSQP